MDSGKRIVRPMPDCFDDVIFEFAQLRKLFVQCADNFWIGERVAAP
jgi:hypothetical protein